MNKINSSEVFKNSIYKATLLSSLVYSMGACSGYGLFSCAVVAIIAAAVYIIKPGTSLLPMLLSFAVTLEALNYLGMGGAVISMLLAGAFVFVSGNFKSIRKGINSPAFLPAVMIACALTITVLITTDYFGIGATGRDVVDMLKHYRSLGFHPNWRGILYGTIVMVVMITFPRKFKKGAKVVSPLFIALVFTYLLNLLLVPKGAVLTFALVERPEFAISSINNIPALENNSIKAFLYILLFAFGEAVTFIMSIPDEEYDRKTTRYCGAGGLIMPALFGFTLPGKVAKTGGEMISGLLSAFLTAAIILPTVIIAGQPLASCAVVLIVGAWQQVEWGKLKGAFSSVPYAVIFLAIITVSLLTNIALGCAAGLIACILCEKGKELRNGRQTADE